MFPKVEDKLQEIGIHDFADRADQRLPKSNSLSGFLGRSVLEKPLEFSEDDESEVDVSFKPRMTSEEPSEDKIYPAVVWQLIGDYILPEQIATFGAVCRDSYAVVSSPSFWLRLFREFRAIQSAKRLNAFEVAPLPADLRSADDRSWRARETLMFGLKAKVIRLLYLRYKPFVVRLLSPCNQDLHPDSMVGLHVLEAWHQKVETASKPSFKYRFKFGRIQQPSTLWQKSRTPTEKPSVKATVMHWEDDDEEEVAVDPTVIFENPEQDACILLVETASLSPLPDVFLGLKLQSCTLNISGNNFQYRKCALNLVPFRLMSTQTSSELTPLVLNDIIRLRLIKWYHPSYRSC